MKVADSPSFPRISVVFQLLPLLLRGPRRDMMGQIVAAMATMHAPQLFTRPPEEDPETARCRASRPCAGWGRLLDETKPDALIVFASDHMETFFLKSVPTFAIMSCENATAAFAGRTYNPPIHQALAETLLDQLVARDFDMAYSQEADLGHSFAAIFRVGASKIARFRWFPSSSIPTCLLCPAPVAARRLGRRSRKS